MALTGLEIFKLLPKSNCKKCGKPTCLAFAMALAQKKAKLEECPEASEEAKSALAEASAPPISLVKFGTGDNEVHIGQETVMFRHEEKFYNPTVIAVSISDKLADDALKERIDAVNSLQFERVGTHLQVGAVAVINDSGSPDTFASAAGTVKKASPLAMILVSESPDALGAATAKVADVRPLLASAASDTAEAVAKIGKENNCPVVAQADSVEGLAELTGKIKAAGVEEIVLSLKARSLKDELYGLSRIRAAALKKTFRPLGYPTVSFVLDGNGEAQAAKGISLICKYSSIVVVESVERHAILPMLTAVMNIFTDPQKPVQVEAKVYRVGEPGSDSPILMTTNFSLTYYTVESDAEASRVPCYILVVDTEGTSVLTAYSGDKLNEKIVAEAMKKNEVDGLVRHHKLIIPGYVAVMSGKLEEETGWEIAVGPRESSMLPKYLQEVA
ncbi:MAG TPA: acetyl-CoA decarbonylase/synthase complex subunit gamma [Planctomycetes bacterium]|nr:acetyl-CoA decarbonylase/synthase complex subunit gamma [Planctomycetota bacterium]HIJ69820.1 acetyl-CoA decarbonylase/synthase complex subunit gamma [Planctomycetota bacterium]